MSDWIDGLQRKLDAASDAITELIKRAEAAEKQNEHYKKSIAITDANVRQMQLVIDDATKRIVELETALHDARIDYPYHPGCYSTISYVEIRTQLAAATKRIAELEVALRWIGSVDYIESAGFDRAIFEYIATIENVVGAAKRFMGSRCDDAKSHRELRAALAALDNGGGE